MTDPRANPGGPTGQAVAAAAAIGRNRQCKLVAKHIVTYARSGFDENNQTWPGRARCNAHADDAAAGDPASAAQGLHGSQSRQVNYIRPARRSERSHSSGWLAAQDWRFGRLEHWKALIPAAHPVGGGRARRRDRRARGAASSSGRRRSPLGCRIGNTKWFCVFNH